jgi:hypothetical protein
MKDIDFEIKNQYTNWAADASRRQRRSYELMLRSAAKCLTINDMITALRDHGVRGKSTDIGISHPLPGFQLA